MAKPSDISAEKMTELAKIIQQQAPGTLFCLVTFSSEGEGRTNYVANANRQDVAKAILELADHILNDDNP